MILANLSPFIGRYQGKPPALRSEFMWMCEACVVINPRNADGNTLRDITAALHEIGASIHHVDEERHVIEVLVPASEVSMLNYIDGVSYVRTHCHFLAA